MSNVYVTSGAFSDSIRMAVGNFGINNYSCYSVRDLTVRKADLVIFAGGADISPNIYGQKNTDSQTDLKRDLVEISIYNYCRENNIPMFGICRGHQLLNALCGGTLFQDIQKYTGKGHGGNHSLQILPEYTEAFSSPKVNSMHHQGIDKLADNFKVLATYRDLPEIIYDEKNKMFGVQFHPECMGVDIGADYFRFALKMAGIIKAVKRVEPTSENKYLTEDEVKTIFEDMYFEPVPQNSSTTNGEPEVIVIKKTRRTPKAKVVEG